MIHDEIAHVSNVKLDRGYIGCLANITEQSHVQVVTKDGIEY